ncbi:MAG: 4-hydroxyphenylacetate 3-hydroxylase N-terminal domain-containing protein, partial [Firmicutes bacterium]|nr:4-hydroxyphenylacetate 3-hydroxylase N-terminal domain-containing protein [Bacillota bacterium]
MMLMTGEQYIESLRKLNTRIYMFGEKIENWVDHPIIRPSINCVKVTYDLAQDPEYADLMTTKSSLVDGLTINRFAHLHQSTEDLKNKVKMQRLCGQKTASCFQRCVGMDAFNATFSTTYEIDQKYGTNYHENFKNFLKMVQENDYIVDGAMTDPKGDRGLPPSAQADPDLFLHIKERREDGIVVRGAKVHQTGSINSHWHIFMPTQAMKEADADYAVAFACPTDAEGMYMIYGRQSCDTRKLEPNADVDLGNKMYGGQEALVVLDDVFIPNEYIFLAGEYDFAGMIVERFAGYHRQSYGGCKVGVGDVLIGAAALAAEYN